jgi:hypothetical protein
MPYDFLFGYLLAAQLFKQYSADEEKRDKEQKHHVEEILCLSSPAKGVGKEIVCSVYKNSQR